MAEHPVRLAIPEDAAASARILNDWIDATDWMPRAHDREIIAKMIADGLPLRAFYVAGEPISGYLSLQAETSFIRALYTARPGEGIGKALIDRAKAGRDYLQLWTHEPNGAAQRFYVREGFNVAERNPSGDDGLPELRMEWWR